MIHVKITIKGQVWFLLFTDAAEKQLFLSAVAKGRKFPFKVKARQTGEYGEGSFREVYIRPSSVDAYDVGRDL